MRRLITAREQVTMLAPWRTAAAEPNHEVAYYRQDRDDLRSGCNTFHGGCGAKSGQPCAPDCRRKTDFIANAREYDDEFRDWRSEYCYGDCGAKPGEKCAADCSNRSEDRAWNEYEQNGTIGFIHDWWLKDNDRNQGSFKSADDFLDYFRDEKWMRSGDDKYDHDKHGETQEEADEIFERRMEGDWGGPYDDEDDEDEDDEDEDWDQPEDLDRIKDAPPLNMGQGLMWRIKHQNDMDKLDQVPDGDDYNTGNHGEALNRYLEKRAPAPQYSDPDENPDPNDPRIKGASLRTASPMFDWRPSPEYAAPGLTLDHHSAPLENGDRLHVYRPDFPGAGMTDKHWLYELEPHDMTPRLPLVWHDHVDPGTGRAPGVMHMIIGRNPEVDPPDGPDRRRRNLSLWGRGADETRPHENGRTFPTAEEAMQAAEQRYREEAPKWGQREPHSREGFDYDRFFNADPDGDDFGDIFGGTGGSH